MTCQGHLILCVFDVHVIHEYLKEYKKVMAPYKDLQRLTKTYKDFQRQLVSLLSVALVLGSGHAVSWK